MNRDKLLQTLQAVTIGVCLFSLLISLIPGFFIPLGLPAEGDAVDYRIPIIKWMIRHGSYPNWQWSFVDDYPMLGELLILPFYAIYPGLGRIIPILGFVLLGIFASLIFFEIFQPKKFKFFLCFSAAIWVFSFRPSLIQANLFMTDNLAAAFLLGSFYFYLKGRWHHVGAFLALTLATRYTLWAPAFGFVILIFFHQLFTGRLRSSAKDFFKALLLASLGALPFMLRNSILNGNPFFPMFNGIFSGESIVPYNSYGRGNSIIDLVLLPYDFLYTHHFQRNLYDYTLGKLFFIQIAVALILLLLPKKFRRNNRQIQVRNGSLILVLAFIVLNFIIWFFTSQQMRFLSAANVLIVVLLFAWISSRASPVILSGITLLSLFSFYSVQKDSFYILLQRARSPFEAGVNEANGCLLEIPAGKVVAHENRDGILGFFDHDFVFLPSHGYYSKPQSGGGLSYDYLYSKNLLPDWEFLPTRIKCLQARKISAKEKN